MKKMVFISSGSPEAIRLGAVLTGDFDVFPSKMKYAEAHDRIQERQPDIVVLYVESMNREVQEMSLLFKRISLKFQVLVLCPAEHMAQCDRFFAGSMFTKVTLPEPEESICQRCHRLTEPVFFEQQDFIRKYLSGDGPRKVLILDHNPLWLQTASDFLKLQYEPIIAADPKKAMWKAKKYLPDIIIIDLELPHMDGKNLLREFRILPEFRSTPILFSTNDQGSSEWVFDAIALRPTFVIKKPVSRENLIRYIDEAFFRAQEEEQ